MSPLGAIGSSLLSNLPPRIETPAIKPPGDQALPRVAGSPAGPARVGFGEVLDRLIEGVDEARQRSATETRAVLLGESNRLHSAMLAQQESSLALTLMIEVRNKLVESYQELMRLPV